MTNFDKIKSFDYVLISVLIIITYNVSSHLEII